MKALAFIGGGLFALILAITVVCGVSYVSANNYGAGIEAQLKAARDDNQNILASYTQKIKEAAQVPDMYVADLKKITDAAIQGRYGPDGSKAVFQFLKEQNPNLDSKLYAKLQQIIESGRDEFKNGQTKMLDVRRQYETQQGLFWRGLWLRIAGFPKVDMNLFKPVVIDSVAAAFEKGREDGPIKLR
jgi:hypothetical protein